MEEDFITQCVKGHAQPWEIGYFVKKWRLYHDGKTDLTLRKYLGMTEEEYDSWRRDRNAIHQIIKERADQA